MENYVAIEAVECRKGKFIVWVGDANKFLIDKDGEFAYRHVKFNLKDVDGLHTLLQNDAVIYATIGDTTDGDDEYFLNIVKK